MGHIVDDCIAARLPKGSLIARMNRGDKTIAQDLRAVIRTKIVGRINKSADEIRSQGAKR